MRYNAPITTAPLKIFIRVVKGGQPINASCSYILPLGLKIIEGELVTREIEAHVHIRIQT